MPKRSLEIMLVGLSALAWAGWRLFQNADHLLYTARILPEMIEGMGLAYTLFALLYYPVFFICLGGGGIAVLFFKKWGKFLIRMALTADVLFRLYGIMNVMPFQLSRFGEMGWGAFSGLHYGCLVVVIDSVGLYMVYRLKLEKQGCPMCQYRCRL